MCPAALPQRACFRTLAEVILAGTVIFEVVELGLERSTVCALEEVVVLLEIPEVTWH